MIIMFGVVMATYIARWMLRQMGEDPEIVWDALTWVLIFGVIGARLYHVLTPSRYSGITTADYLQNPLMILTTWEGGLAMPGAIIGGVLGIYIFSKRNKIKIGTLLDAAAPGIALAQAIGRWGNYINQELYGPPTDLPWGIYIAPQNRLLGYKAFEYFHPLFLYESIWNLLNMFFLHVSARSTFAGIYSIGLCSTFWDQFQSRIYASYRHRQWFCYLSAPS